MGQILKGFSGWKQPANVESGLKLKPRISFGVRGVGGEIGDTTLRVLLSMKLSTFEKFQESTGGVIHAFIRLKEGKSDIRDAIMADRVFKKLVQPGSLKDNTASSYGYIKLVERVEFDRYQHNRLHIIGVDGRKLIIDFHAIPSRNVGIEQFAELDLLIDATGAQLKKVDNPDQDPNHYAGYPNLNVMFSAPVKTVDGIPHHLNGINDFEAAQLNATGSCTTHAGVDLIFYILKSITDGVGIQGKDLLVESQDIVIEGGMLDTTHSLTPSDNKFLKFLENSYVPQTTGFGGAAAKVFPMPHIGNIDATTGRYNSYFDRNDVQANGISIFSLTLVLSIKAGNADVTADTIRNGLFDTAMDMEGRKHIGIVAPGAFEIGQNKKTGIFTALSLTGMTPTVMLPLGENIGVVKIVGEKLLNGNKYDMYIITVNNAGYDNRLGFTADFLEEANRVAGQRLGRELIPGFNHPEDVGDRLAFVHTPTGRDLFSEALEITGGELIKKAPSILN